MGWLIVLFAAALLSGQQTSPQPLTLPLTCGGKDCSLLTGVPQTNGMRGGFVRLRPGESVGSHSTENHEEALVILRGSGKATVEDRTLAFSAGTLVYIPPHSRHNVTNTSAELLEYTYVVAPVMTQK